MLKSECISEVTVAKFKPVVGPKIKFNSTSYPKVANTRKEAQCELMYISDSTNRSEKSYTMNIRNYTYE